MAILEKSPLCAFWRFNALNRHFQQKATASPHSVPFCAFKNATLRHDSGSAVSSPLRGTERALRRRFQRGYGAVFQRGH
jgi:hypothetical protein